MYEKKIEFGTAKDLVNKLIGWLGYKYKSKKEGFMTVSLDDVFVARYKERDKKSQVNEKDGFFLVNSYLQYLKLSNNTSFLRFVVDGGARKTVYAPFKVVGEAVAVITGCVMAYADYTCQKKVNRKKYI